MATPVASESAAATLRSETDEVVALQTPSSFWAVGQWYRDFDQTSDEVVVDLLARQRSGWSAGSTS
jgi:predicted phosphoribosyltransferase